MTAVSDALPAAKTSWLRRLRFNLGEDSERLQLRQKSISWTPVAIPYDTQVVAGTMSPTRRSDTMTSSAALRVSFQTQTPITRKPVPSGVKEASGLSHTRAESYSPRPSPTAQHYSFNPKTQAADPIVIDELESRRRMHAATRDLLLMPDHMIKNKSAEIPDLTLTQTAADSRISSLLLDAASPDGKSRASSRDLARHCLSPHTLDNVSRHTQSSVAPAPTGRASKSLSTRHATVSGMLKPAADDAVESRSDLVSSCLVCLESLDVHAFPLLVSLHCAHTRDVCRACLARSIDSQIDSVFWDEIKCPICSLKLDHAVMRSHATAATFERYDTMSAQATMRALAGWWECPQAGCGFGGVHDSAVGPIVYCHGCGYQACFECGVAWLDHQDMTCEQYQRKLRNDARRQNSKAAEEAEAAETIQRTTKPCPGAGCGVRIEKNAGCHHMKCSRCRHQFCWDCLVEWSVVLQTGNDAHEEDCPWHSNNIR